MTAFANPLGGQAAAPRFDAAFAAWNTVGSYEDYADAQRAVDFLSDRGFPVEHLDIVGQDLRLVERVTGRLTKGRAALAGAASGMWFGLFMGTLLALFTTGSWLGAVLLGVVIGSVWGGVFGFLGHAATRGARDFASARTIVALRYDIVARNGHADSAKTALEDAGMGSFGWPTA